MAKYVFIQSRDPFSSVEAAHDVELVSELARAGSEVTLFLVQNGVLPARRSARSEALSALARSGVRVLADDFSLRVRGITAARLAPGVEVGSVEAVLDAMCEGGKAVWH